MKLSGEEYEDVRKLQSQVYAPNRVEFAADRSYFEGFREKEFGAGDVAELYHENTKVDEIYRRRQAEAQKRLDERGTEYAVAKIEPTYEGAELLELPEDVGLDGDLETLLSERRSIRQYTDEPVTLEELSAMLLYGAGINEEVLLPTGFTKFFRTYPSGGGLYPVETYVGVTNVEGLDAGVYHYDTKEHGLRVLDTSDAGLDAFHDSLISSDHLDLAAAPVVFVLTAAFWRAKAKYGPRSYRYTLQESGHLAQNLLLAAQGVGLGGVPAAAFRDREMNDTLDLDGVNEATVYAVAVGNPRSD